MLPEAKRYARIVIESNPTVMRQLVGDRPADDPFWDFRPYPDRFSIRFVLAHIADWDPIFAMRIDQIATIDRPILPAFDEGQMAIDNGYATQDPIANLARWAKNRAKLIAQIDHLPLEALDRVGERPGQGVISISDYTAMIALHDSYHISQAVDYTERYKKA